MKRAAVSQQPSREVCRRYRVDDVRSDVIRVNNKQNRVAAGDKLASKNQDAYDLHPTKNAKCSACRSSSWQPLRIAPVVYWQRDYAVSE